MARTVSDETVQSFPDLPLPADSTSPPLLNRLIELGCPDHLVRQAACEGPAYVTWDVPYRGAGGAPKWAWAILNRPPENSPEPESLRVDSREFALVFSGSGELIRARDGARYLSGPERALFYDRLHLGAGPTIAI